MPEAWRVRSSTSTATSDVWFVVSFALGLTGLFIRAAALAFAPEGTSSRDTHQLRAPSLNTTGMYSIVRNPLYVGNALLWLGAVASLGLWWLVALTALLYWLYIERVILVEEGFLEGQFGRQFTEWASGTPAFVPNPSSWRPASGTFSWRRLSSEHNGLLGISRDRHRLQSGCRSDGGTAAALGMANQSRDADGDSRCSRCAVERARDRQTADARLTKLLRCLPVPSPRLVWAV